jgi:hypothetical protein
MIPGAPERRESASHRALPNPIYRHLTRNRRWPSARVALLLGLAFTFLCSAVIWLIPLLPAGPDIRIPILGGNAPLWGIVALVTVSGSVLIGVISPTISGVITALTTVSAADDETITLLRLTHVGPWMLMRGHFLAALFRLRWLWILCYGLLLPAFLAALMLAAQPTDLLDALNFMFEYWEDFVSLLFWGVVSGALLGSGMNLLTLCASLWAGLHFRRPGPAAGVALGIALISFIGLLATIYIGVRAAAAVSMNSRTMTGAATIFVMLVLAGTFAYFVPGALFLRQIVSEQSGP